MDQFGFEKIKQTLEGSLGEEVEITPEPEEGENVRHVTIRPLLGRTRPAIILNALNDAGLLDYDGRMKNPDNVDPVLKPLGIDAFGITFEDKHSY